MPIYMVFPRLFTCPTLETTNFKVGRCTALGLLLGRSWPQQGLDTLVCWGRCSPEHPVLWSLSESPRRAAVLRVCGEQSCL